MTSMSPLRTKQNQSQKKSTSPSIELVSTWNAMKVPGNREHMLQTNALLISYWSVSNQRQRQPFKSLVSHTLMCLEFDAMITLDSSLFTSVKVNDLPVKWTTKSIFLLQADSDWLQSKLMPRGNVTNRQVSAACLLHGQNSILAAESESKSASKLLGSLTSQEKDFFELIVDVIWNNQMCKTHAPLITVNIKTAPLKRCISMNLKNAKRPFETTRHSLLTRHNCNFRYLW